MFVLNFYLFTFSAEENAYAVPQPAMVARVHNSSVDLDRDIFNCVWSSPHVARTPERCVILP